MLSITKTAVQPTLVQLYGHHLKYKDIDKRSKKLDRTIGEMMATDNQPFTVVSDIVFRRVINVTEQCCDLKSEKFY